MRRRTSFALVGILALLVALLPALPAALAADGDIVINEVRIDQPEADDDEYFELAGPASAPLDGLSYLVIGDGTGGSGVIEEVTDLAGQSLGADGLFVAAESTFTFPSSDLVTDLNFENSDNVTHLLVRDFTGSNGDDLDTDDDGVLDVMPWSEVVDLVALVEEENPPSGTEFHYGPPSVGPDGIYVPGHAYRCDSGWQIGLFIGGDDTPGAPNLCAAPPVVASINEVRIDQPGEDLDEYFELAGPASASLDGLWYLVIGDGTGGSGVIEAVVDLLGSSLGADGLFVAAEATFTLGTADLVTDLNFENSDNVTHLLVRDFTGSNGDDLDTDDDGVLDVEPWSELVDLVALVEEENPPSGTEFHYGPPSVGPDGIYVPGHAYRCESGWQIGAFGGGDDTPGAANVCAAPMEDLVINELDYDQPSTDTAEFIEIKNDGTAAVDLDGWLLTLVNGTGGGAAVYKTIALPAVSLAAGDYFVVCANAATVANCDLDVDPDTNLIQNGAPDAVALYDGDVLVDTVSYEGDTGAPYTEGSGAGLEDAGDGSISRCPDGADTDVNNSDFTFGAASPGAENPCVVEEPFGACGDPATLIHSIQGSGLVSPDVGVVRTIEGIVVGDFDDTATGLDGFFLQEEDADADADPMTSEGIFVYNDGFGPDVSKGDTVRVRGTVAEYFELTELRAITDLEICPATGTATPAAWSLPVVSVDDWETVEGMEITISDTLFVSGNYTQGRYGEVDLSVGGPLDNPTNIAAPGAPALAVMDANALRRIQLDDGSTLQNPLPLPPYLGLDGTLRTGDTTEGLTGAVGYAFGVYEMHPTQPVSFTRVNDRPAPPEVGGRLTVAASNVLNYFTTIDDGSSICGPLGDQDCRGADSAEELARQRAKLVAAISSLDADVVGLMEIENHPGDVPTADLVAGLNDAVGAGTYDYVATGAIGGDAIRLALIYQPAMVTPLGEYAVLDSSVDPTFDDAKNRPALAQSFVENATGAVFTVAVNHLKSKGSDCNDVGDPDVGDGQGNCNLTRTAAAAALAGWLAGDPTGSGSDAFLIVGDLNAYAQEDPITTLEGAGWTDLIEAFVGTGWAEGAYSYNFFSESGYLDHALASPGMLSQVTGAAFWHVNADEPAALDYNDYNQPALFSPDEFRSSDHDPVVVGLDLDTPARLKAEARDMLAALLPTGDRRTDHFLQKAVNKITQSLREAWWVDEFTLHPKWGKFVFDREHHAVQYLMNVVATGGPEAAAAQEAIDLLIAADRWLASEAISDAAGGDAKWLGFAEIRFAQAEALAEAGDYGLAVLTYRKAWRLANKAGSLPAG